MTTATDEMDQDTEQRDYDGEVERAPEPVVTVSRRVYRPSPTLRKFHGDDALVRGVMGPTGSGKSVGMVAELWRRAKEQAPDSRGMRCSRALIVRNTYPELRSTTIPTWEHWLPIAPVVYGAPITWHFRRERCLKDGTGIDFLAWFLAVDRPDDVKKLKSLEATFAWMNEASECPEIVLTWLINRVGRYPSADMAPISWHGVVADTNAVDEDHWWYRKAEVERPHGWHFYRQPAAVVKDAQTQTWIINPLAENVEHQPLGARYWLQQTAGAKPEWIRVMLQAEYGTVTDGKPVFTEYFDQTHCASEDLKPYPGLPLHVGFDFGLTPAAVLAQVSPKGQLRVLAEYCSRDMGIRQFLRDVLKPELAGKYAGMKVVGHEDPAGLQRAQTDERTCHEEIEAAGIAVAPAPTQAWIARRESVAAFLLKTVTPAEAGNAPEPGFQLSPGCQVLRKGFLGKYAYKRVPILNEERYKDEPDQASMYAHPQCALQYIAVSLDRTAGMDAVRAAQPPKRASGYAWI